MFALMISWTTLKMGYIRSKARTADQILEETCTQSNSD